MEPVSDQEMEKTLRNVFEELIGAVRESHNPDAWEILRASLEDAARQELELLVHIQKTRPHIGMN